MRILFITNFYPPSDFGGGYMQLCEEVAHGLLAKGHPIAVLTSIYCDGDKVARPYPVHHLLALDPDWHSGRLGAWQFFVGRRRHERQAVAHLRRVLAAFSPDVVFIWHTLGLPRVLLQEAEGLSSIAVAYYLADYVVALRDEYIDYWTQPPVHWTARLLKQPLSKLALRILASEGKPVSLRYENAICVSEYVRRRLISEALIPENSVVVHNGVDLSVFTPQQHISQNKPSGGLKCLIAGRVVPEKGVHTAVEALGILRAEGNLGGVRLCILGDGPADYLKLLLERVDHHGLHEAIEFRPRVPRVEMPAVLAEHDVLVLASEYDEPLARSMQEGMAMGLLVVGTTTGGSGELLVHEKTGLVFEPGSPESLAAQLVRARTDPQLAATLAENGRREVVQNFSIQRTIEQVEQYLLGLVAGK